MWRRHAWHKQVYTDQPRSLSVTETKCIVPGGMARLPFMKGGLGKAGMPCIGGPGLNCIAASEGQGVLLD